MADCNCSTNTNLPIIKQGDDVYLRATIYFNGAAVTASEVPLLSDIEYCFEDENPRKIKAADAWNDTLGAFLLPVSQENTFALEEGRTNIDIRVRFYGGNVLGARQRNRMKVLEANSMEILTPADPAEKYDGPPSHWQPTDKSAIAHGNRFGHAYLAPIALSGLGSDIADGYTMQGGAVNSDTGEILIAFHKANTAASILKLLNADWSLKATYSAEIGHANDLTYVPDDKAFYIADGETEGLIHILDADSMEITGTKQIPNVGVIASIDYLPRQQIFFICDYPSKKLYRCSKDFSKVTSVAGIPNTVKEYDTARSSPYMQGGAVIGGEYVQALWYYGAENKGSSYTRLWFLPFSGSGSYFVDIRSQSLQDESEFLLVDGGEAVLVGYADGYITRCGIYAAGSTYDPVIALDGAMCRSVDHIPVNSMGRVRLHQNTSPTGQEIVADYHCYGDGADKTLEITYGGRKYYRVKSSGAWGSWVGSLDSGGTAIQGRYVPSSAVNGLRLTHGDNAFSALVMVRSNQGLSDTLFFVAGYGVGGAARDHAHMLISNTGEVSYSYEIDGQSIVIHSTATISNVSITILSGSMDDLSVSWEVT